MSPAADPRTEARALLDVLATKLENYRAGQDRAGANRSAQAGRPFACPECGHVQESSRASCPWCRLLEVLRGEHPEVTSKLMDAAGLVVSALQSVLSEAPGPAADMSDDAAGTAPVDDDARGNGGPGLHRIDIR